MNKNTNTINKKIYAIARTSRKGDGVYLKVDGKFAFPLERYKGVQPGPVIVEELMDKGTYYLMKVRQHNMSLPSDKDIVRYLSENPQSGNLVRVEDEMFGSFYVAPNGDVLSNDERDCLRVFGKGSQFEKILNVVEKIDITKFLVEKKFKTTLAELYNQFDIYFKKAQSSDENIDYSYLSEVENQILRPKRTKAGIYYYAFNSFVFERNIPYLSKEDMAFLVNEFNNGNRNANQKVS